MNRVAAEARGLSDADLAKQLEEAERQLFTLRFQVVTPLAAEQALDQVPHTSVLGSLEATRRPSTEGRPRRRRAARPTSRA